MSIDTGRERIDERRPQRTVVQLAPGATPGQAKERSTYSPSRKSVGPSAPMEKNVSHDPQEKAGVARDVSRLSAWLGRLRYYGLALLLVGAAALLRWALSDVLKPAPSLVFYLAWVGAAAFGGLGPGLLATVASWLCVEVLFDFTPGNIGFNDPTSIVRLLVFLAGGLVVSVVGERMQRTRIHERRQGQELADANAALRASEEKYRFLVENSKDITGTIDLQGKFTFVSGNVEKMTGYRPEELIGKTIWDFLAPECHDLVKENLRQRLRGEDVPPYELLVVGKDGRRLPSELAMASIVDDRGNIVGVQGVCRDITERKRAEAALRASEAKYRFLVENSKDVTWMIDLQSQWMFISSTIEKVTGYRADELIGQTIWGLLAPECHDLARENMRRRVRGEDLPPYEVVAVGKDGRRTTFEVYAGSIIDDGGHVVGVQGVARDITERKRAEAALRESEQRYRGIVEDQTELICLFDDDQTLTFVNDAYCRYFGKKREELVGHKFLPLIAEEDREAVKVQIAALNAENPLVTIEERVHRPDGRIAWQEWKNRAVFDGQGRLSGYQAVGRDITKRRQVEQDLSESRNRYQTLIETTADFIWEMDASGKYTYCSPQMKSLWGYEPKDMIGKTPFDVMPPKDRKEALAGFLALAKSPQPFTGLEASSYDRQGRLITVEISGVPFFDADGRLLGFRGISRDVTERKRAQEALAESRKKYRGLVEKVNDWVWEIDANGVYTYSSPRALDLLGYSPEEIVGKTPFDLMPPAEAQRVWDAFRSTWLEKKPLEQLENTLVRKDGRLVTVETSGMPVFAEDGVFRGYLGIDRDVTARKRAEEALRASQSMLQSVMDNVPQGIFWKDRHSTYLGCNKVFAQAAGLASPGDIIGKTDYDLPWSSEQTASFREYDRRIMENDAPEYHIIEQQREVNGRLAWLETNKVPLHDAQGQVIGILGTYEDITEREQAEEALRESEEKYRRIVETATEAIVVADANGRIVFVNDRWSEIVGYGREEAEQMTVFEAVFPDDMALTKERWESRKQGRKDRYEFRLRRKDGSAVWVLISMTPRFGSEGEFLGELIMAVDITKRKQAEEALRKSEEKFAKAFRSSPIAVAVTRLRDGRILDANEAMLKLLHFTPDEVIGHTTRDLGIWVDLKDRSQFIQMLSTAGSVRDLEYRLRTKDGAIVTIHLSAELLEFGGEPCLLATLVDVTERKQAEQELRELNTTLESRVARRTAQLQDRARQLQKLTLDLTEAEERERARIAEILHDDLQQVLAAAKFQVSLLGSRIKDNADAQEIAGQAKDLLTDAIAKSRGLSHELSAPALAQSDLGMALEWLAEHMQTKHGFTVHLEAEERIEVASEPLRILLYKAAQELLFNAIKHAGVQEAKLRLRRQRGRLRLSVSDQGRGFDPTDPSYKLGFGLLSIRERIGLLGGRLKIRSAVGKGSTFVITVPEAEGSP